MKSSRKSKGEPVFAGTVDAVLAEKIVSQAKKNSGNGRKKKTQNDEEIEFTNQPSKLSPLVILAAILGIVSLLSYSFLKKFFKRYK